MSKASGDYEWVEVKSFIPGKTSAAHIHPAPGQR